MGNAIQQTESCDSAFPQENPYSDNASQAETENSLLTFATRTTTLILAIGALILLAWLAQQVLDSRIPFDTDEADHANAGIELYTAIVRGDIAEFGSAILRQAFYPPLHSFFVAAGYLATAPTLAASRLPSVILFGLSLLLACLATHRTLSADKFPQWVCWGSLSLALFAAASSPISILLSVLCMLEPLGLALVALLLWSASRLDRASAKPIPTSVSIGVVVLLITLTKYSFGMIIIPATLAALLTAPDLFRQGKMHVARILPALLLVTVGLGLWTLVTDRHALSSFFTSHPSYAALLSAKNLLFYPRAWLNTYCASSASAYVLLALLLIGSATFWRKASVRLAVFCLLSGLAALTLSTTNEIRHLMVVLPCAWFLAGLGLASCLMLSKRVSRSQLVPLALLIACLLPLALGSIERWPKLPRQITKQFEGHAGYADLQNFIVQNVDVAKPGLVFGAFDQFGIEALQWKYASAGKLAYTEVRLDHYPFRGDWDRRARRRMRNRAYPWTVEGFPRKGLQQIIAAAHYEHAILVSEWRSSADGGKAAKAAKAFRQTLQNFPQLSKRAGGLEVTLYNLEPSIKSKTYPQN